MNKKFIRFLGLLFCIILALGLCSCEKNLEKDYHDGYVDGYEKG